MRFRSTAGVFPVSVWHSYPRDLISSHTFLACLIPLVNIITDFLSLLYSIISVTAVFVNSGLFAAISSSF